MHSFVVVLIVLLAANFHLTVAVDKELDLGDTKVRIWMYTTSTIHSSSLSLPSFLTPFLPLLLLPFMKIKILGQSGKMSVNINGDESQITVTELTEVDVNGNAVGCTGSTKHCVKSFASQEFTFGTSAADVPVGDTTASQVVFTSTLPTGTFAMNTMIINKDGEVTNTIPGGKSETLKLTKGDCKFNVILSGWNWCTGCSGGTGTGAFIDVTIEVKGTGSETDWSKDAAADDTSGGDGTKGNMGGSIITLSNTVNVDSTVMAMPTGYPLTGGNGNNKNTITLRFPKFTTSAFYDPVISSASKKLGAGYIILISVGAIVVIICFYFALKSFGIVGGGKDEVKANELQSKL